MLLCGQTTEFTCRDGRKERDVSENRNAGPLKCNDLLAAASLPGNRVTMSGRRPWHAGDGHNASRRSAVLVPAG